jgi:beta-glucosidase
LIGFRQVRLKAGQSRTIHFTVTPEMLMAFDEDGKQWLEPGRFRLRRAAAPPAHVA